MMLDDKVYQQIQKLPSNFQEELVDFIEYLLMKAEEREKREWASLSLESAMRDMENEPGLYTQSDLKVVFG